MYTIINVTVNKYIIYGCSAGIWWFWKEGYCGERKGEG